MNWGTDESKINIENIRESNLFAGFDEHIIDDCFCGEYSRVTLKINETVLQSGQGKGRLPVLQCRGKRAVMRRSSLRRTYASDNNPKEMSADLVHKLEKCLVKSGKETTYPRKKVSTTEIEKQ